MILKTLKSLTILALLGTGLCNVSGKDVFSFSDNILTIRTERYELQWYDGAAIRTRTFLPVERELTASEHHGAPGALPNGPSLRTPDIVSPKEYHPWFSEVASQVEFKAPAPPPAHAPVAYEPIEDGGARLTYKGLGKDASCTWIQEFRVDPGTGDLRITQKAGTPKGYLSGISTGWYHLDASIPLAVPAFPGNGQVWRGDERVNRFINIAYPRFWSAAIVIGMIPDGGSFAIWSEDENFQPKYFRNLSDGKQRHIGFEAAVDYPFDHRKNVTVSTWRFNTFSGNWTEPAKRYRDFLSKAHGLVPLQEREPAWVGQLSLIWTTTQGNKEQLARMSENIDPDKTILWDFTGSTKKVGLNLSVPDYIPKETFTLRNARAREAGFHIASYYSAALVDVHAHPNIMKKLELGFYYDALYGKERTEAKDRRLIYVHPGSDKWRKFYAEKMRHVFDHYHVDFMYQDVAGTAVGSSGLVNGLNFNQAIIAVDKAVLKAVPEAALGGEYWNEATVVHEVIGLQRSLDWGGRDSRRFASRMDVPHPICSLLFSPFSYYHAYKVPQRSGVAWHHDQNMNEVIGALPNWLTSVDDESPEARITLLRAKLWADGFKPWFPEQWEEGVSAYMRDPKGALVRYRRTGNQSYCTLQPGPDQKESLVYARVSGVERVTYPEPVMIPDWIAYDESGPIGLQPDRYYCLFPGDPQELRLKLTHLPQGAELVGYRQTDSYLLAAFNQPVDQGFQWEIYGEEWNIQPTSTENNGCLLGYNERPPVIALNQTLPLESFYYLTTLNGFVQEEQEKPTVRRAQVDGVLTEMAELFPPNGGKESEAGMETLVTLPDHKGLALKYAVQRLGGKGDGVHLVVRINGQEVSRSISKSEAGIQEMSVDLEEFAGQSVVLGIHADAGRLGYNRSNDYRWIGAVHFEASASSVKSISTPPEEAPASQNEDQTYR